MKTGNKLGQLGQLKGRRQNVQKKSSAKREKMRKRINKQSSRACWHLQCISLSLSHSTSLSLSQYIFLTLSVYELVHSLYSSLRVHSAKRTSYLLRMRARARCLMRAAAATPALTSTWPHVLALRQAARMRIIKRQRQRTATSSSPSLYVDFFVLLLLSARQRRLAAFAFLILHFSIALQLVGVLHPPRRCAASAAKWRQMRLDCGGVCVCFCVCLFDSVCLSCSK